MVANSMINKPKRRQHLYADAYQDPTTTLWFAEVWNRAGQTVHVTNALDTRAQAMAEAGEWIDAKLNPVPVKDTPAPAPGVKSNGR